MGTLYVVATPIGNLGDMTIRGIETLKMVDAIAAEDTRHTSDAGTPGISDPGAVVVGLMRKAGVKVVPIPGASAVIAALSASGITQNGFHFHGFLPASGAARRK
eukprot:gene10464-13276_t